MDDDKIYIVKFKRPTKITTDLGWNWSMDKGGREFKVKRFYHKLRPESNVKYFYSSFEDKFNSDTWEWVYREDWLIFVRDEEQLFHFEDD